MLPLLRRALEPVWFLPRPTEPIPARGVGSALGRGRPFTVLSWNIQFAAGRNRWFFYDGGPDVRVTATEVEHNLAGITSLIASVEPDLVLLQEVDRNSVRTARIDQHERLRSALRLACDASTPYFKVPFVPVPVNNPLGRVDLHLSVFSRFTLGPGTRTALAPLREPAWRRAFNLRRAVQHHPIGLADGGVFDLFQTHLSAFALGDGSLERQGHQVAEAVGRTSGPALLAGDFNALPPGDDPQRLGHAAILYADATSPLAPLLDAFDLLWPSERPSPPERFGTYVPWGSRVPDRTLDYAFGRGLTVHAVRTIADGQLWSDHLPVVLIASIP